MLAISQLGGWIFGVFGVFAICFVFCLILRG